MNMHAQHQHSKVILAYGKSFSKMRKKLLPHWIPVKSTLIDLTIYETMQYLDGYRTAQHA